MKVPPFHWWRTVFFLVPTIAVYTIVLGTVSLGASLFERHGHFAHWCARAWAWLILATTGVRLRVSGLERLQSDVTYIFVANHQSIYDIPIVFASLPYQLRIIAKASLGRFPFLGWHLRRTGHLLVDRGRPRHARILAQWKALVANGVSLIIFPEGTRSVDGSVGRFKAGSLLLAIESGLPVVPLSIVGSRRVMQKGRLRTEPGHVQLVIHEPIATEARDARETVDAARALAERARDIVIRGMSSGT